MLQKEILKQMITFNKTAFENAYNVMMALQEQMEKSFRMFMEQAPGFPVEGKKVLDECMNVYKKGCQDFKKNVDESFKKVETFFQ